MIFEKADWILENQRKVQNKKQNTIEKDLKTGNLIYLNGIQYIIKIISGTKNHIYVHHPILTVQIKENYINSQKYINNYFEDWLKESIYLASDKLIDEYLFKLDNLIKGTKYIKKLENKSQICIQYEVGFSELMKSHGVDFVTRFVQFNHRSNVVYRRPYRALRRGVPVIKKSGLKNMFGFDFVARYVKNPKLMNAIRENALRYNVQFRRQGWMRRIFK